MRYLILSDLHGNFEALAAVLEHSSGKRVDGVLLLGDLVGYGAAPNEVVDAVRAFEVPCLCIRGNHDKFIAGLEDGASFNSLALAAAYWSSERLTAVNSDFIRGLQEGPLRVFEGVEICHGSPLDEDDYVLSAGDAALVFAEQHARLTFFGHTHIPTMFCLTDDGVEGSILKGNGGTLRLDKGRRYLLNPGSVGQPRDRDPRASIMVYDSDREEVEWMRVPYGVELAQQRILDAGLPRLLAERLALGV